MRTAIAKEIFNRKMSLLISKLNIELRKKLDKYYVWSIAFYDSDTWTQKIGVEIFRDIRNLVLEENGEEKMAKEVTNEELGHIREKKTLLNNILCRKANWVSHILKRYCFFKMSFQD